jgi:hypothetical protein
MRKLGNWHDAGRVERKEKQKYRRAKKRGLQYG